MSVCPATWLSFGGQTDIVYEVDVDRSPLIIDASFRPDSSAEDIAELRSVIGSIVMDRW